MLYDSTVAGRLSITGYDLICCLHTMLFVHVKLSIAKRLLLTLKIHFCYCRSNTYNSIKNLPLRLCPAYCTKNIWLALPFISDLGNLSQRLVNFTQICIYSYTMLLVTVERSLSPTKFFVDIPLMSVVTFVDLVGVGISCVNVGLPLILRSVKW